MDIQSSPSSELQMDIQSPPSSELQMDIQSPPSSELQMDIQSSPSSELQMDIQSPPSSELQMDIQSSSCCTSSNSSDGPNEYVSVFNDKNLLECPKYGFANFTATSCWLNACTQLFLRMWLPSKLLQGSREEKNKMLHSISKVLDDMVSLSTFYKNEKKAGNKAGKKGVITLTDLGILFEDIDQGNKYKDPCEAFLIMNHQVLSGEYEFNISNDLKKLLEKTMHYDIDPMKNLLTVMMIPDDEKMLKDLEMKLMKLITRNPRLKHYYCLWKCEYICSHCGDVTHAMQISASLTISDITVLCKNFEWSAYRSLSMDYELHKCSKNCDGIETYQRSNEKVLWWPKYIIISCNLERKANKEKMYEFLNVEKKRVKRVCTNHNKGNKRVGEVHFHFPNDHLRQLNLGDSSQCYNLFGYLSNPMTHEGLHYTLSILENNSNELTTIHDTVITTKKLKEMTELSNNNKLLDNLLSPPSCDPFLMAILGKNKLRNDPGTVRLNSF
jgi:hypothetical protein